MIKRSRNKSKVKGNSSFDVIVKGEGIDELNKDELRSIVAKNLPELWLKKIGLKNKMDVKIKL